MMFTASILLVAAALQGKAPSQTPSIDMATLLVALRTGHDLPALGGALVTTEGIESVAVVGRRSVGGEAVALSDDLWHLGSCTKAMTATLAARLVERGLLTWDTTVGEVFVDLRERMDPAWSAVSIRLLLCNRAGAPADLSKDELWSHLFVHTGTPREQRRALVEGVLAHAPLSTPGTHYLYSNAGFSIAGAMLETLTDTPWEDLMRREVFEPLGMTSAGFGAPGTRGGLLDQPLGHHPPSEAGQPQRPQPLGAGDDNPSAIAPAGKVHASLADWGRFVQAHLRGARGEGAYLKPETWKLLHTPLEGQDYGFGWSSTRRDWAGGMALTHSGSNTMWYCTAWLAPERGFAVLVTTNLGGDAAAKGCDAAAAALIGAYRATHK